MSLIRVCSTLHSFSDDLHCQRTAVIDDYDDEKGLHVDNQGEKFFFPSDGWAMNPKYHHDPDTQFKYIHIATGAEQVVQ